MGWVRARTLEMPRSPLPKAIVLGSVSTKGALQENQGGALEIPTQDLRSPSYALSHTLCPMPCLPRRVTLCPTWRSPLKCCRCASPTPLPGLAPAPHTGYCAYHGGPHLCPPPLHFFLLFFCSQCWGMVWGPLGNQAGNRLGRGSSKQAHHPTSCNWHTSQTLGFHH